ncbi:cytochrome P450 [Sorangium sp. So ce375]|uniref:cytochrome P450 n=1 Tax=Sorangium sp. So ce375 TaxID=3133306 RepID=UPI003F5BBD6B
MDSSRAYVPDDLGSTEFLADPYPLYRAFRDGPPVYFKRIPAGAGPGIDKPIYAWGLLKYADILAAVRDPEAFSSNTPSVMTMVPRFTLLHDDPPRHTLLRRLVSKAFSPRRVSDLEPWLVRVAGELVDKLGEGPTEILDGLARPLPMRVICALLGIPSDQAVTFRHWSEATIGYAGIPAEERRQRIGELHAFLGREVAARRAKHTDDLIAALVEAEIEGARLNDAEAVGFCMTLLVAGNETTTGLIGNCLHILAQEPELWRRAREDRGLVEPILTETLRYASPTQRLTRVARRTVEIGGATIPEGSLVDVVYGAANRDPAVFSDPDTFRVDRPTSEGLAFGSGIHFCLGAALAKTEARIALNAMLDRYARVELGAEPAVRQRVAFATLNFVSLPLVLYKR